MQMPFGKHRGKDIRDVPCDYLLWVLDKCDSASPTLLRAIREHLGVAAPQPPPPPPPAAQPPREPQDVDRVIRAWHRRMALKYHPDRGGTQEQMLVVNEGAELLRQLAQLN